MITCMAPCRLVRHPSRNLLLLLLLLLLLERQDLACHHEAPPAPVGAAVTTVSRIPLTRWNSSILFLPIAAVVLANLLSNAIEANTSVLRRGIIVGAAMPVPAEEEKEEETVIIATTTMTGVATAAVVAVAADPTVANTKVTNETIALLVATTSRPLWTATTMTTTITRPLTRAN